MIKKSDIAFGQTFKGTKYQHMLALAQEIETLTEERDYWKMQATEHERGKEQWKASARFEAKRSRDRAEWVFKLQHENAKLTEERDYYRGRMNEQADRVKELEQEQKELLDESERMLAENARLAEEVESLRGKDNTPIKEGDRVRIQDNGHPHNGKTGTVQWVWLTDKSLMDVRIDGDYLITQIPASILKKI